MNNLLVENEYHCITASFRRKILNFRVFSEKIRSSYLFRRTRIVSSSRVFLLESARESSTPRAFSLRVTRRIFTRGHFTSPHEPLYEPRGRSLHDTVIISIQKIKKVLRKLCWITVRKELNILFKKNSWLRKYGYLCKILYKCWLWQSFLFLFI